MNWHTGDERIALPSLSSVPRAWWLPPLAVAIAGVLVYLNSLANGFAHDDVGIIVENQVVHNLSKPFQIWLTPYWPGPDARTFGLYRPLTVFLFAIQWSLGEGAPLIFHVSNVLLHAFASALVYRLLLAIVGWKGGVAGGLLFAVHPVHVEAVANVVGQGELLSACFVLAAAVVYSNRNSQGELSPGWQLLLPSFYLMGMLAKEHAIVLPLLLLALDLGQRRWRVSGYLSQALGMAVSLFAVASVYLVLRWIVLGGGISGDAAADLRVLQDPVPRLLTALSVWPEYLRLMVFPFHLSAMYDPETLTMLDRVNPSVVAGGVLLLFLAVTALLVPVRPAIGLGSAWLLVTILPVSNLLVPIGTLLAERTLYLPSVAMSLWTGFLFRWAFVESTRIRWIPQTVTVTLGFVLLAFSARVVLRNPVWDSNETLFEQTLRDHPENFRAQWFRAQKLDATGDPAASLAHWNRALEIYDGSSVFLTAYAEFLYRRGKLADAQQMIGKALEVRPDSPNALFIQGLIEIAGGQFSQARERIRALETLGLSAMARQLEDSLTAAPDRSEATGIPR